MSFVVDRDGEYRATFVAEQDGLYEIAVAATRGDEAVGAATRLSARRRTMGSTSTPAMRAAC